VKIFIDAEDVATRIGYVERSAFLRARLRLERDCGFPMPLPTSLRPLRWRADQVAAWADAQGRPGAQMADMATLIAGAPNVVLMAKARAA